MFAQRLHRLDMRLRLGLLQDPAAIDRQIEREAAELAAKKTRTTSGGGSSGGVPTVKTQEQTEEEKAVLAKEKKAIKKQVLEESEKTTLRRIRPLSEAKAIDSGATFISEAFLFMVAGGLIIFETWRARRKEGVRREQVEDRLSSLEDEIRRCREQEEASEEVVKDLKDEVERLRGEKAKMQEEKEKPIESSDTEESPEQKTGSVDLGEASPTDQDSSNEEHQST